MKQLEVFFFDENTVRKNTYEFVEHVEEILDLMANVLDENCDQARAVLLMFPSSIMWQTKHERFYLRGVADAKYTWDVNQ